MMKRLWLIGIGIIGLSLLAGCATNILAPTEANVPPSEKFGYFTNVTLEVSVIDPKYANEASSRKAVNKIDEVMNQKFKILFPQLNNPKNGNGKTLVIKPQIQAIKFVGGGKRAWAGGFAGDSVVLLQVDYFDAQKGKIIASPKFYARAKAIDGDYSMGGADNAMLHRIVSSAIEYTTQHK